MSQYEKLDSLILECVARGGNPLYQRVIDLEAVRIAEIANRKGFRVIDGRLQALKKSGLIVHRTKSLSNGKSGWYIKEPS